VHQDDSGGWPYPVDPASRPQRSPGPINLHRNSGQPAYSGIATFMGLPVALTQEDLRAGAVDVAVLGCPVDMSTGHRGAAFGPRAIRGDERYLFHNAPELVNASVRVKPFSELTVVDYGDAAVDMFSVERSMGPIGDLVTEIAETGAVPVLLGGDHSILWPSVRALAGVYGVEIAVLHFDAHPDCHDEIYGHKATHASPIWRLLDEGIPPHNIIQVGMRTPAAPDNQTFNLLRKRGVRAHFMAEIERIGFTAVLDKVIAEAKEHAKYVYLSVDIDVLDPAFAPGTGTPEPGGLTNRELLPAFRRVCHETQVIGMDVVEVAPHLDPGYSTALNARRAIFEGLTGMAMRKSGITAQNYMNPVAAGQVRFPLA
jgi:agmatinase